MMDSFTVIKIFHGIFVSCENIEML